MIPIEDAYVKFFPGIRNSECQESLQKVSNNSFSITFGKVGAVDEDVETLQCNVEKC